MSTKILKIFAAILVGWGFLSVLGLKAAHASSGNFTLDLDHAVAGSPEDYKKSATVQVEQGEWVNVRLNSTWSLASGCWPEAKGPRCAPKESAGQIANTVAVWKADTCLPGADCAMHTYSDKEDSKKLTWNIIPNFSYQPYLSIKTTENTPEGAYPITFSLTEHPESCRQSGGGCIASKSATVKVMVKAKKQKGAEAGQCEISSESFKFLRFENTAPAYWAAWRELEFYDQEGKKLSPTIAGGSGDWVYPSQGAYGKSSAIDGNSYTQWNSAAPGWITPFEHPSFILLDFGRNVSLGRMRFQTQGGNYREASVYAGHSAKNTKILLRQIKGYYDDMTWIDFDCNQQDTHPQILLNPSYLSFAGVSGGSAPAGQETIIKNTGTGDLNWTVSANGDWCHVLPSSGTLAPGELERLAVTVDKPSNAGSFSCQLDFVDPNAANTPQRLAVNYTVSPPPVGDPSLVSAAPDGCGKIKVSWRPGDNALAHNLYRAKTDQAPAAPYKVNITGTFFVDSGLSSGSEYFYWVQSAGGTGAKVAADSGSTGGVEAASCLSVPKAPQKVAADNSQCGRAALSWSNVSDEAGYYIYRSPDSAKPAASGRIKVLPRDTVSYADQAGAGIYYYWVSSYNAAGESPLAPIAGNFININSCQADLSQSDKNLKAVNGTVQANSDCDSGSFQGLPPQGSLKQDDILVFEINLCNIAGQEEAANVIVTESLNNLASPPGGWKAAVDGQQLRLAAGEPGPGEYSYSKDSSKLVFNIGSINKGAVRQVTYEAKVTPQANAGSGCLRCQNSSIVNYFRSRSATGTVELHMPALYFVKGN